MVEDDLAARGIAGRTLLRAFASVPRELFVPAKHAAFAYDDRALPIGSGQTISQPYIVARTLAALELTGEERVLEVGTGSGYAAALLGRVAREVHTVERIEVLARTAEERLGALGVSNVHVHVGDGTLGYPAHAPYDAIVVAAAGPVVPEALLEQLAVGGRLVMPTTAASGVGQTLVRIRRVSADAIEKEELEPVRFVPLIGARGYASESEAEPHVIAPLRHARPGTAPAASRLVGEVAGRIEGASSPALGGLVERLSSARLVLFGESTHGTSEFYRLRARLSEELIDRHGFDFVAVEADWPDAARINDYVTVAPEAHSRFAWEPFARFPQWMWRNQEVVDFCHRLRARNAARDHGARTVGFHGLDLYSMYTSIGVVLGYLDDVDPAAATLARSRYARLLPWQDDPQQYAIAVGRGGLEAAEATVMANLRDLLAHRLAYAAKGRHRFFDAAQNARLVASAERYYRSMFFGHAESWNLRDSHMFDTLRLVLASYGPRSKGIVWAHNSHVGDARATEMAAQGEHNLGQLCRGAYGHALRTVGFATDHGVVAAARDWDEPVERMRIRPGHPESYEHVFHQTGIPAFVLQLRGARDVVRSELSAARLLRAIGVVYRPDHELSSHYLESVLPVEFDELVWFDETSAVTALAPLAARAPREMPETFPFAI